MPIDKMSGQHTGEAPERAIVEMMLASGGDERIAADPLTGRNRYGTPRGCSAGETWFSSSTASGVSSRGFAAAARAFGSVMRADGRTSAAGWFEAIRARLFALFGIPGAEVVLAGSGTEAEIITFILAANLFRRAFTSLVIAPKETGSGVLMAAEGRHFLNSASFSAHIQQGQMMEGLEAADSKAEAVDIRDSKGEPLSSDEIDEEVVSRVESILQSGCDAVVHVLDASKTGRSGPRRATAAALLKAYSGRVAVVVDACQLRCSPERIRADLEAGFIVMITGSKFAGGPPFSGALLLPPAIVAELKAIKLPRGFTSYSAAHDWPSRLFTRFEEANLAPANLGLGLRWEAALAELESLYAADAGLVQKIKVHFADLVTARIAASPGLEMIDPSFNGQPGETRTIFPVVTSGPQGDLIPVHVLHCALRQPASNLPQVTDRIFHVGQPVTVGDRAALRICLSAPQIVDIIERLHAGQAFETAFAPLDEDLDALLHKWTNLINLWPSWQSA